MAGVCITDLTSSVSYYAYRANSEPRRVAELLSCLPPELDVESMVKGVVVLAKDNSDGKGGEVSRSAASNSSSRSWGNTGTMARGGV
jgi:hypothetical protein